MFLSNTLALFRPPVHHYTSPNSHVHVEDEEELEEAEEEEEEEQEQEKEEAKKAEREPEPVGSDSSSTATPASSTRTDKRRTRRPLSSLLSPPSLPPPPQQPHPPARTAEPPPPPPPPCPRAAGVASGSDKHRVPSSKTPPATPPQPHSPPSSAGAASNSTSTSYFPPALSLLVGAQLSVKKTQEGPPAAPHNLRVFSRQFVSPITIPAGINTSSSNNTPTRTKRNIFSYLSTSAGQKWLDDLEKEALAKKRAKQQQEEKDAAIVSEVASHDLSLGENAGGRESRTGATETLGGSAVEDKGQVAVVVGGNNSEHVRSASVEHVDTGVWNGDVTGQSPSSHLRGADADPSREGVRGIGDGDVSIGEAAAAAADATDQNNTRIRSKLSLKDQLKFSPPRRNKARRPKAAGHRPRTASCSSPRLCAFWTNVQREWHHPPIQRPTSPRCLDNGCGTKSGRSGRAGTPVRL
ncbi:hypothetical protein FN846DRAFT_3677 [Sphaerosporella brunnea]|uniref:Uncharacterized protein n=1 Tax=Sphaerosporella brunnea TaxID=1250544 RepID=A0A5J5FC93_9PEZI|nr:hypothetical protein FN846DRAFT_3677 [Sphaerosporella brunnea]